MKPTTLFRTLLLTLLMAVAGSGAMAQTTVLFPTQNASWSVYSFSIYQSDTLEYYLEGDTLLYGGNWSKLFRRNLQGETNYCGAIKQIDGIVEIKLPEEERRLLYDFTLEVGDTFPYSPFFYGYDDYGEETYSMMVVERVDTVQLLNGESRREIVSNMVTNGIFEEVQERWIEGIGSIHGPLFPLNPKLLDVELHEEFSLVCFSENDELLYHNPRFAGCLTATNMEENELFAQNIQIYPNPARNFIVISPEYTANIKHIIIYDSTGKIVIREDNTLKIDISRLGTGMYLCKVEFDNFSDTCKFFKY